VDVELIKMNDEVIHSRMRVFTNLFNRKLIDDVSFYKAAVLVDEKGKKKEKIKAKEIKSLSFTNFNDIPMKYVNDGTQLKILVYDGKIKWFKRINRNIMDGSISYFDYLVNEEGKVFNLGLFNHRKNKLNEALKNNPKLIKEIEDTRMDDLDLLGVLERYDEMMK
jgi:hypothetical protein